jgi:low temperature requirement protein LtrA
MADELSSQGILRGALVIMLLWWAWPGHFSERHGLIVIVALGESIVAIGVGVAKEPISSVTVVASMLGLVASVIFAESLRKIRAGLAPH